MLTPGPNPNPDPRFRVPHLTHASPLLTASEPKEESSEPPRLGELTVTGVTPDSLRLSWTVARGPFDSFVILYKDAQGQPQSVPIEGDENEVTVPGLEVWSTISGGAVLATTDTGPTRCLPRSP